MQESSHYAVGIDIGTKNVRCVVSHMDGAINTPKIIGFGVAPNVGLRKGTITNLNGPAEAIDKVLEEAEKMSGHAIKAAALSINGTHILSAKADGMVAVGTASAGEVSEEDIERLEEVASTGKVPANREVLEIVPHAYRLDGQDGIKDPLGMTGTRLEIRANIISALVPHLENVRKVAEMIHVEPTTITPAVLASAHAVLNESQRENGVAVIDLGGATTSVAVFEEGDVQYAAVVPMGGQQITNDLAIGLKTDPDVAEAVKLAHARAHGETAGEVETKIGKTTHTFNQQDIDEIVEARLEEIFEAVYKELKKVGRAGKLPSGAVLVGGGAQMKGIVEFAKEQLGVAVKIGVPSGFAGVSDDVAKPEFAAAIGLMLIDGSGGGEPRMAAAHKKSNGKTAVKKAGGVLGRFFALFR